MMITHFTHTLIDAFLFPSVMIHGLECWVVILCRLYTHTPTHTPTHTHTTGSTGAAGVALGLVFILKVI